MAPARSKSATAATAGLAVLAGAVVLGVAPAAARAATRVAIFSFEGYELPKAIEMAPYGLTGHVARRLEAAGMVVVEPALGLRDMLGAMGCTTLDETCAPKIAAHEKVDVVVAGTLYGDVPARKAGKRGKEGAPLVWVRVQVFPGDGSAHREIDETATGTVTAVTAEFDRLAALIAAMIDARGAPPGPVGPGVVLPVVTPDEKSGRGVRATTLLGIGAIGAGAAGVVVAVVMAVRWHAAKDAFADGVAPYRGADGVPEIPTAAPFEGEHNLCRDGPGALATAAAADLESRGVFEACGRLRASMLIGALAAGAAGVLVGAGVVLLVAGGGTGRGEEERAALRLSPVVGPGSAGVVLDGRF